MIKSTDDYPKTGNDDSKESSELKKFFMAKLSHELRSPLNAIIGFAELMYHGKVGPVSPEHKEYLSDILTSSRHLLLLVNDVLDFAKIEAGKMEFYPEEINVEPIIEETKLIFQTIIDEKKLQIKIEIDPELKIIHIDPVRFKQIIYNYVSNAVKVSSENGVVIIRLRAKDSEFFILEVEDFGMGIRNEDLSRLFVEFQQLDKALAKKYPSTGLGLALTKQIVEAQGGEVGVKSTFGKGSVFYATLPRQANKE